MIELSLQACSIQNSSFSSKYFLPTAAVNLFNLGSQKVFLFFPEKSFSAFDSVKQMQPLSLKKALEKPKITSKKPTSFQNSHLYED